MNTDGAGPCGSELSDGLGDALGSLERQLNERIADDATTPVMLTFERAVALWNGVGLLARQERTVAKNATVDPDPLHLSRILHELAGSASLCWNPSPAGVFDSEQALKFVEDAIAEIRSRMAPNGAISGGP